VAILAVVVATVLLRSGEVRGVMAGAGLVWLVVLLFRGWAIATIRARRYLVRRSDWGDVTRLVVFFGLLVAGGFVVLLVFFAFLMPLDALDRIASGR
jgi:hypothetical protein